MTNHGRPKNDHVPCRIFSTKIKCQKVTVHHTGYCPLCLKAYKRQQKSLETRPIKKQERLAKKKSESTFRCPGYAVPNGESCGSWKYKGGLGGLCEKCYARRRRAEAKERQAELDDGRTDPDVERSRTRTMTAQVSLVPLFKSKDNICRFSKCSQNATITAPLCEECTRQILKVTIRHEVRKNGS